MNSSNESEKRRHSRVDFKTDIQIVLNAGGKTIKFDASSIDLSLKGIFITSKDTFDAGTRCEIDIILTGSIEALSLNIKGTVARKTDTGMGISFDSMELETYAHLKNIITYNTNDNNED